jgi:hypothetical protein
MRRRDLTLARTRTGTGRLLTLALLLTASCTSPEPVAAKHPATVPFDCLHTGPAPDEQEIWERVAGSLRALRRPRAGRPEPWVRLHDRPAVDLVTPASDEDMARWIGALGQDGGEARTALLRQGIRVAGRLREAVKSPAPTGPAAAAVLSVLEPRFDPAWTAENLRSFVVTGDGTRCLAWTLAGAWNLWLFDAVSGNVVWARFGSSDPEHPWNDPCWHFRANNPHPAGNGEGWIVARQGLDDVEVTLATGDMALVASPNPPRRSYTEEPTSPTDESTITTLADGTRVAWDAEGVLVSRPHYKGKEWSHLTRGTWSLRPLGVSWTASTILTLYSGVLAVYDRETLKMIHDPVVPEGASWMSGPSADATIVLGGRHWTSFAVLRGMPPVPVGRVETQVEGMTAMAADPGGRWIATADENNVVRLFLATTLERLAQFDGGMKIAELRFVGDGSVLLASSPDNGWARDVRGFRLASPGAAK